MEHRICAELDDGASDDESTSRVVLTTHKDGVVEIGFPLFDLPAVDDSVLFEIAEVIARDDRDSSRRIRSRRGGRRRNKNRGDEELRDAGTLFDGEVQPLAPDERRG